MSIISDALKKAAIKRRDIVKMQEETLDRDYTSQIRDIAEKKTKWNILSSLGAFFIIGFAIIAFLYNIESFTSFVQPDKPVPISVPKQVNLEASLLPIQRPKKETPPPQFVLNGITEGAGEPLAVINNDIFKKGDIVAGAQIVDITSDRVILLYKGKEVALKIK